ncbi:MAG: hypothetical protein PWQ55_554 [Chloroflexota bacterium]|nr:hypothetical protein [Chloroflexota bacterium]
MTVPQETLNWLLAGDPAIRWQVIRDLQHAAPAVYEAERARLPQVGWCARLLQAQDADGLWNGSLYNGKWRSTTYSLYLLRQLGLAPGNPQALQGCRLLLEEGLYRQQEIRFSRNQAISDLGVTAIVLSLCAYFGLDVPELKSIAGFLLERQSADGSWLTNDEPASQDYVFETTLLVLEALHQAGSLWGAAEDDPLSRAVSNGRAFLLARQLGLSPDGPLKAKWTTFSFPPYWFYDLLTALDHFSATGAKRDPCMQAALQVLRRKQSSAGTWKLGASHPGKTWFEMESPGRPSRWNTLRALRVLDWWGDDASQASDEGDIHGELQSGS